MAKPQSFKRIIAEDFKSDQRELISKLASSINIFADDVLNCLNKHITIDDNLNWTKKEITVTVDSNGDVTNTTLVKTGLDHTCEGITVIKVSDLVNPGTPPNGSPFITYSENTNGVINISNIKGLVANNQYKIKIILF